MLLGALCLMILTSGVSPQWFEQVHDPAAYAHALRRDGSWLRTLLFVDDAFIAAYVIASVTLASALANGSWRPLPVLVAIGGVGAGVLDLAENHHVLGLLRIAELERAVPMSEILRRAELSQLKWMVAHLAFTAVGVAMPRYGHRVARWFRYSLIFVQLPLGAAAWVATTPWLSTTLGWGRLLGFVAGFAVIAWLYADRDAADGAETGVPG